MLCRVVISIDSSYKGYLDSNHSANVLYFEGVPSYPAIGTLSWSWMYLVIIGREAVMSCPRVSQVLEESTIARLYRHALPPTKIAAKIAKKNCLRRLVLSRASLTLGVCSPDSSVRTQRRRLDTTHPKPPVDLSTLLSSLKVHSMASTRLLVTDYRTPQTPFQAGNPLGDLANQ